MLKQFKFILLEEYSRTFTQNELTYLQRTQEKQDSIIQIIFNYLIVFFFLVVLLRLFLWGQIAYVRKKLQKTLNRPCPLKIIKV